MYLFVCAQSAFTFLSSCNSGAGSSSTIIIYRYSAQPATQRTKCSDLTNTSTVRHRRAGCARTRNRLALEVAEERSVRSPKRAGAAKSIQLTSMSKVVAASSVGARRRATKELSRIAEQRSLHILERIALGNDHPTSTIVESVTSVGVEIVVDCVKECVATDLGAAAGGMVDIVTLHSDQILGACQVDAPIVVAIAGGGPAGGAVELIVGKGNSVGGTVAGNEHLAADEGDLDVIYVGVSIWTIYSKVM